MSLSCLDVENLRKTRLDLHVTVNKQGGFRKKRGKDSLSPLIKCREMKDI